jgi:metal-sulfur cluster biosynthetic enzyme
MITKHRILELLDYVKDPEIPVFNVLELCMVGGVVVYMGVTLKQDDRP